MHMQMQLSSTNLQLYPKSIVSYQDVEYGMARTPFGSMLVVLAPNHSTVLEVFEGEASEYDHRTLIVGSHSARNATSLRALLPWLQPRVFGVNTSMGMGDRLGIATPGHVRAVS